MTGAKVVRIGERMVGPGQPVFVIAEAGVNHNGDMKLARRLVDVAADAGADAVKFQTFRADRLVSSDAPKARYQLETTDARESQFEMIRLLELTPEAHRALRDHCRRRGILFLSTPFDEESVDLLNELDVPAFKVPSGEVTNWPLLRHVGGKGKPIILSTGMAYLGEVEEAVARLREAGADRIVLLHCVSNYPAEPRDVNLRAMATMAAAFGLPVGYSDHTLGIAIALAAVAVGACVIEKHFTLDRGMPGPDHRASLEPEELRAMISGIRAVEAALGTGRKAPARSEEETRRVARRSVAAMVDIPTGIRLEPGMLGSLRPGDGIPPSLMERVLGRKTRRAISAGHLVLWSDVE